MSSTSATQLADMMKVGAESANARAIIGGLDGAGWARKCETLPMCTLPPGAGALVVKHFRDQQPIEALNHLRSARAVAHPLPESDERRTILNAVDAAINLLDVGAGHPVREALCRLSLYAKHLAFCAHGDGADDDAVCNCGYDDAIQATHSALFPTSMDPGADSSVAPSGEPTKFVEDETKWEVVATRTTLSNEDLLDVFVGKAREMARAGGFDDGYVDVPDPDDRPILLAAIRAVIRFAASDPVERPEVNRG